MTVAQWLFSHHCCQIVSSKCSCLGNLKDLWRLEVCFSIKNYPSNLKGPKGAKKTLVLIITLLRSVVKCASQALSSITVNVSSSLGLIIRSRELSSQPSQFVTLHFDSNWIYGWRLSKLRGARETGGDGWRLWGMVKKKRLVKWKRRYWAVERNWPQINSVRVQRETDLCYIGMEKQCFALTLQQDEKGLCIWHRVKMLSSAGYSKVEIMTIHLHTRITYSN